mgnify:CR=1 FL=1
MSFTCFVFICLIVHAFSETQEEFLRTLNENHEYDYHFTSTEKMDGLTYKMSPEYIDGCNYINGRKFGPCGKLLLPQLSGGYFYVSSDDGHKFYFNLPRWIENNPIDMDVDKKKTSYEHIHVSTTPSIKKNIKYCGHWRATQ